MLMDEANIECPNSKVNIYLEQQYILIFPQARNLYNIYLWHHISMYIYHRFDSIKEFWKLSWQFSSGNFPIMVTL